MVDQTSMKLYEFGDPAAKTVLIQPVDDHDLSGIENEVSLIAANCAESFRLIAVPDIRKRKSLNRESSAPRRPQWYCERCNYHLSVRRRR